MLSNKFYSFLYLCLGLILLSIFNKSKNEDFNGIGKSFAMYYPPQQCCKSNDCYPGMYLGNDFWIRNWLFNR